ncbi:glycosyltransferase involved in cell wall biosynthesis [Roseiarcus fermentans]|uniref:Glycosyltransferase involved in cell wall biosynthesis n=1 Tax=Roseiarcus fermentans TaxID=1473586 RepID=A0A366F051_9HYPH|nr:glycosyltransferase [Roseiarcus fermentans]RBP07340.1 glycosyltransferase involved in cell wall biosynthesis [Roseiarcus fermentans]
MRRRITIILPDLNIGGAERVSVDLSRQFLQSGYDVDFALMNKFGEFLQDVPLGAQVVDLKVRQLRNLVAPLARYLKMRRPDAVLVNLWPLTAATVLVARAIGSGGTRVVTVDHATLSIQYRNWGLLNWLALRASLGAIYPLAHARVAVSVGVAEDISRLGCFQLKPIEVVNNPVTLADASPKDREDAERAWEGWTGPRIISVGKLKRVKNHALLIKAFKQVVIHADARMLILGDGELRAATEQIVRDEGLSGKVLLPGSRRKPRALYESADLFVLSSDSEGLGNVLIEALACGLPVVSTDCRSGPREILDNGRYGALTPVGDADALARAMLDSLSKTHDRDALRRRAADFSPEIAAEKYLRILFPDEHGAPPKREIVCAA